MHTAPTTRRTILTAAVATPALAIPAAAETIEDLIVHRFRHFDRDWCALVDPTACYVYSSVYLLTNGDFAYADWCGREMFVTRCDPLGRVDPDDELIIGNLTRDEFDQIAIGPVVWQLRKNSEGRWITTRR